jgi:phosphatidylglycerophosphatase C
MAPVPVVVFDFDGTLVRGDSFLGFSARYCLARPLRLILVLAVLPVVLLTVARWRNAAGSLLLWAMTVGISARRFVKALRSYAERALPERAYAEVFEELERHLAAGSRVVIATASLPTLVRVLLRARNMQSLPIVGTRLRSGWCGLLVETHCIGRMKVKELGRRLHIEHWSSVYTDSIADRSLMRAARHITLIAPNGHTLASAQRLVAPNATLRVLQPGSDVSRSLSSK